VIPWRDYLQQEECVSSASMGCDRSLIVQQMKAVYRIRQISVALIVIIREVALVGLLPRASLEPIFETTSSIARPIAKILRPVFCVLAIIIPTGAVPGSWQGTDRARHSRRTGSRWLGCEACEG